MARQSLITRPTLVVASLLACCPSVAQDADAVTRADLEQMLRERDAAIIELQQVVAALNERLSALETSLPDTAISSRPDGQADRSPDPGPSLVEPGEDGVIDGSSDSDRPEDPSRIAADPLSAERALERTLVQNGTLLLGPGQFEFVSSLGVAEQQIDFVVDTGSEGSPMFALNDVEQRISTLDLTARFGLALDTQLEVGIPVQEVSEKSTVSIPGGTASQADLSGSGIGDLRIGIAKTLMRESNGRPDLVGRLTWGSGSGDRSDGGVGLGGGFESVSGSLSLVKRRDPLAFFASVGHSSIRQEDGLDPGDQTFVTVGAALAASPRNSIFASITQRQISSFRVGSDAIIDSAVDTTSVGFGVSTIVGRRSLLNFFTEIGASADAQDYVLNLSLSSRVL